MTSSRNFSSTKEILLLGGGHTHALVLKALKRNPIPGVRVVVISDSPYAAYSGMLPALVERQRSFSEAHIDIAALANCVDALFIEDSVIGLDADRSVVTLQKRGEVEGDVLSLNVGILSPVPIRIAQSGDVVSVKPVGPFLQWLATLEDSLRGTHKRIAVVGGG
ncbi:MAG: hypothetical protein KDD70_14075, partial [Bdellovibrionales bacterium]|nr:hypothetical protein [Bdellovibrionales bacterium]